MIRRRQEFGPDLHSVAAARRFVVDALRDARDGPHPCLDAAQLSVSELATNAVEHARTGFEVDVAADGEVVIGVTDHSDGAPVLQHPHAGSECGRGLLIVERSSDAWGIEPAGTGKRVWCRFTAP